MAGQIAFDDYQDTLSPRIVISNNALKNLFAPAANPIRGPMSNYFKTYDPGVFIEDESGLSMQGRVFVEFFMVYHDFGNDLIPVVTVLDVVDSKEKNSIDKDDLEKILRMSDALKGINNVLNEMLNYGKIPTLETTSNIIMRVNSIKTRYAELVTLRDEGHLSESYARILNKGIKCIDFVIEYTDAVLYGVKEEKFDIKDLFKQEVKYNTLDTEELIMPELFGYRSGLNFVIKNLRYNILNHAGHLSQQYSVKIIQDDENIIIRFADKGRGFNIENLREKAVELGFWDRAHAGQAREDEIIELIFRKGFSRRYEKGTAHGLGLWLCREVLKKYFNAAITAENAREHTGAVFTISIPMLSVLSNISDNYLLEQSKKWNMRFKGFDFLEMADGQFQLYLEQSI